MTFREPICFNLLSIYVFTMKTFVEVKLGTLTQKQKMHLKDKN